MNPPDISGMLPSEAKKAVTEFILKRMKEKGRGFTGNPLYSFVDMHSDFNHSEGYLSSILPDAYEDAYQQFRLDKLKVR